MNYYLSMHICHSGYFILVHRTIYWQVTSSDLPDNTGPIVVVLLKKIPSSLAKHNLALHGTMPHLPIYET